MFDARIAVEEVIVDLTAEEIAELNTWHDACDAEWSEREALADAISDYSKKENNMKRERKYDFGDWSLTTGDQPSIIVNMARGRFATMSTEVLIDRETAADMLNELHQSFQECSRTKVIVPTIS